MEITDMEVVCLLSRQRFFSTKLFYHIDHWMVYLCVCGQNLEMRSILGTCSLEVAVWMVEEFSERMLITPLEEC